MLHSKRWSFGNYADKVKIGQRQGNGRAGEEPARQLVRRKTLEWVRSLWPDKLIVKGILDAEDAKMAVDAGADAILVSNHGGRQLDSAPSTASVLCRHRRRGGDEAEVYVDSGVAPGSTS